MTSLLRRLLTEEDGPTAVEYAVLLALIVISCISAVYSMSNATANSFDTSANELNNAFGS